MNRREFLKKVLIELKRRIMFFNINNKNVRDLADRQHIYKFLKRRYKKIIENNKERKRVNSEYLYSNKVWICWFQGYQNAPDIVKKCIDSVKQYMQDKEINIINEKNYREYVEIPEYIIKKWKKGIISYAHFSDILRLELLTKYGGLWLDATVFMTSNNYIFSYDIPLFVFKSISLNRSEKLATSASNWLIYSCKDNNILMLTKELLYKYWRDYNYVKNYYLFHICFTIATEVYEEEWHDVPTFSNIPPHILQFELKEKFNNERFKEIMNMTCFHKLNKNIFSEDKESVYSHIMDK